MGKQTETELPRPPDSDGVDRVVRALHEGFERLELQDAKNKPSTVPSKIVGFFGKRVSMILGVGLVTVGMGAAIYSAIKEERRIAALEEKVRGYKHTPDDIKLAAENTANCIVQKAGNDNGITDDEMSTIAEICKARTLQQLGIKTSP